MVQNLSPEIDSNKLFTHFSRVSHAIFSIYSTIFFCNHFRPVWSNRQVCLIFKFFLELSFTWLSSARVMRDENGGSRGFGFVSYHEPEHGKI